MSISRQGDRQEGRVASGDAVSARPTRRDKVESVFFSSIAFGYPKARGRRKRQPDFRGAAPKTLIVKGRIRTDAFLLLEVKVWKNQCWTHCMRALTRAICRTCVMTAMSAGYCHSRWVSFLTRVSACGNGTVRLAICTAMAGCALLRSRRQSNMSKPIPCRKSFHEAKGFRGEVENMSRGERIEETGTCVYCAVEQ